MNIFNNLLTNGINTISGGGGSNNYSSPIELFTPINNTESLGNFSNYGNFVGGPLPNYTFNPSQITPLIDSTSDFISPLANTTSNFISPLTNTASNALNTGNSLLTSTSNLASGLSNIPAALTNIGTSLTSSLSSLFGSSGSIM